MATIIEMAADIVAAHASTTNMTKEELVSELTEVYNALSALEKGEAPDVFASANMKHPETLASKGWGTPVVLFVRNQLCALAQPDVDITTSNFFGRTFRR